MAIKFNIRIQNDDSSLPVINMAGATTLSKETFIAELGKSLSIIILGDVPFGMYERYPQLKELMFVTPNGLPIAIISNVTNSLHQFGAEHVNNRLEMTLGEQLKWPFDLNINIQMSKRDIHEFSLYGYHSPWLTIQDNQGVTHFNGWADGAKLQG